VTPLELERQAIDVLLEVHSVLVEAYGGDLRGSNRGPLVSSHYLARIRDRLLGYVPPRAVHVCASCIELRTRLVNIYHLTLTGESTAGALAAVREASGPGAPAPANTESIALLARELLEAAGRVPPRDRFDAMVRAGLIDADGRMPATAWGPTCAPRSAETEAEDA